MVIDIESYDPAAQWGDKSVITIGRYDADGVFKIERIEFPGSNADTAKMVSDWLRQVPKPPLWRRLLRPVALTLLFATLLLLSSGAS